MAEAEPSTSASVSSISNDLLQDADKASSTPFSDPIQRTKCLIQYIRIRKQRAENELARRNALRKQKKDAKATVQNARESLRSYEEEVSNCEQRLSDLNRVRHDLYSGYKSVINKESERKRQRKVAAVEARKNEEQLQFQRQYQSALAIASQLLAPDHPVLLQLKNTQLIQSLFLNPSINIHLMQLILSLASYSNVISNNLTVTEASRISTSSEAYNSSISNVPSQNVKTQQNIPNVPSQNVKTQQNIPNVSSQNIKTQQGIPNVPSQNIVTQQNIPNVSSQNIKTQQGIPNVPSQNIVTQQNIPNVSSQNIKTQQGIPNVPSQNVKTQQGIPNVASQNIKIQQARQLNSLQQQQQLSNLANKATLQQQMQQKFSNNVAFNLMRQNYSPVLCPPNQQFPSTSNLPLHDPAFLRQYQQQISSSSNNPDNAAGLAVLQRNLQQNLHQLLQSQFPVQTSTNNPVTLQHLFANAGLSQETIYQTILANLTNVSKSN